MPIPTFMKLQGIAYQDWTYDTQVKCTLWTDNDVTIKNSFERPQSVFTASEGSFHGEKICKDSVLKNPGLLSIYN